MDFGRVTPLYAYRMFGGSVSIDEITNALNYLNQIIMVIDSKSEHVRAFDQG